MTEPVVCTLADLLYKKNIDKLASNETNFKLVLIEFLEGLQYLSDVCFRLLKKNTLHLNISPETVFLTEDGRLKLGGFSFISQLKVEGTYSNPDVSFQNDQSMITPLPEFTSIEVLSNKQK